jgi:hypothetical protein
LIKTRSYIKKTIWDFLLTQIILKLHAILLVRDKSHT